MLRIHLVVTVKLRVNCEYCISRKFGVKFASSICPQEKELFITSPLTVP